MVELTGLNKEYFDAFLSTYNKREQEHGKKVVLEDLNETGGVAKKEFHKNFPVFIMKNGDKHFWAPRGHKFSSPLIPEGMDIKQFEVK